MYAFNQWRYLFCLFRIQKWIVHTTLEYTHNMPININSAREMDVLHVQCQLQLSTWFACKHTWCCLHHGETKSKNQFHEGLHLQTKIHYKLLKASCRCSISHTTAPLGGKDCSLLCIYATSCSLEMCMDCFIELHTAYKYCYTVCQYRTPPPH